MPGLSSVAAKTASSITTPVTLSFFVTGHRTKIRLITARISHIADQKLAQCCPAALIRDDRKYASGKTRTGLRLRKCDNHHRQLSVLARGWSAPQYDKMFKRRKAPARIMRHSMRILVFHSRYVRPPFRAIRSQRDHICLLRGLNLRKRGSTKQE